MPSRETDLHIIKEWKELGFFMALTKHPTLGLYAVQRMEFYAYLL